MTQGNKAGKGLRQDRCILTVDGLSRYGSYEESMIIGDRQFFFTFLKFDTYEFRGRSYCLLTQSFRFGVSLSLVALSLRFGLSVPH